MKALKFSTIVKKIAIGSMVLGLALPSNQASAAPADDIATLKQQLAVMQRQMAQLQSQLKRVEAQPATRRSATATAAPANGKAMSNAQLTEEVEYMNERLNKAELHTATDKLSFNASLRSRVDSIHTEGLASDKSLMPAMGFGNYEEYQTDNDALFTTRLRLDMKAKVSEKFEFMGRLTANKVWGDALGINHFDGTGSSISYDGNAGSLPSGNSLLLERAYFNYKGRVGQSNTNFSLGRRPSTNGSPTEYASNSLVGGSPLASIINWQFDGASLSFGLDEYTGIEGSAFKLCYGVGFEGDIAGDNAFRPDLSMVEDVHLGGFIADLYDDDVTSAVLNYAHAWGVTDNFVGTMIDPVTNALTRVDPTTNLGSWDALSLLLKTNLIEAYDTDIDIFAAASMSWTTPNGEHLAPTMGSVGLLNDAGDNASRRGHSIYAGIIFPLFTNSKWGFEYNYGSKYWFNFTGAEDALTGSKLASRGQVFESYFIQPIYKDNFFVTFGAKFYDYKYSNSGSQLGEPKKIDDMTMGVYPVVDKVQNYYISLDANF